MSRKLKRALFTVMCLCTLSESALAESSPEYGKTNANNPFQSERGTLPNSEHQDEPLGHEGESTSSPPQEQEAPAQPPLKPTHEPRIIAPHTVEERSESVQQGSTTGHARDTNTLTDDSRTHSKSAQPPVEQSDRENVDAVKANIEDDETENGVSQPVLDTEQEGLDMTGLPLPQGPLESQFVGSERSADRRDSQNSALEKENTEPESVEELNQDSQERQFEEGRSQPENLDEPGVKRETSIGEGGPAGDETLVLGDSGDCPEVEPSEEAEEETAEKEPGEDIYGEGVLLIANPLFEERTRGYSLLQQAAEMGNSKAKAELAFGYLFGSTLERNFTAAFEIFNGLAARGNPAGQYGLGFMYSTGIGLNSNQAKAILYYTFAALGGDHYAQMAMGYRALMGISVVQSCEAALSYYYKAAKKVASEVSIISGGQSILKIRLMEEENEPSHVSGISEDDLVQYHSVFADSGNARAQLLLGVFYMHGMAGAERNFQIALRFLHQAADEGLGGANALIGKIYAEGGPGVKQSNETALKYFKKAADQNHADGFTGVGMMYFYGMGVPQDYVKAVEQFTLAADKGSAEGQYYLGRLYLNGYGIRRDYNKAMRYFQLASHGGFLLAVYSLAEMHAEGMGIKRDCNYAVELFKNVAERGKWSMMLGEAQQLYSLEELDSALVMYLMLAEMGLEVAQTNAAYILEQEGVTIVADNETLKRALILWNRAAAQGYSQARVKLGDYYYYGQGTVVNYEAAASQYRIASDKQSSAQAMFNLGYMYEQGLGLEKDYHLAKRYYDMAADTSSDALVPVNLALFRLNIISFYSTNQEFFQTMELSAWFEKLDSVFGEDWDIYVISVLAGAVAALVIWRARR